MSKVEDFMAKLKQQQPKTKEDFKVQTRALEKIYLNFPGNFGRYQVLPMNSVVTDYPFVTLFNTREIQIPRKNIATDGTENVYKAWVKILPKDAYSMQDSTGRIVSSLTAAEDQLLSQAYMMYDNLAAELDAANNREPHVTNLIRKRNYTLFHGYCLNKWNQQDPRNPERQNFSGLFVITAKGFINTVQNNIEERALVEGDLEWVPQIYNNQLRDRDGFLMFSVTNNPNQAGYMVTAQHEFGRAKNLAGVEINQEDADLMLDPVSSFLGWQAKRNDDNVPMNERRYFNAELINEAIMFMSNQLGAIRMAKTTGLSISDAITRTSEEALASQVHTNSKGQTTNDPMLSSMAAPASSTFSEPSNPGAVFGNNNDPYATPPAAHIDPVTSAPTSNGGFGSSPFSKPAFATNQGEDRVF